MKDFQVICVCGGIGFPIGANGAPRIINVGRALQAAGISYRVLHCGPTPASINTERSGIYLGIPFEYTTWMTRPANAFVRLLVYLRAVAGLTSRLCKIGPSRRRTAVYLWIMDGPLVLYTGILCKLLGIPVVQEMNEWYPSLKRSAFVRWLYRKPIFSMSSGVIVISKLIESRVRERSAGTHSSLLIQRLATIIDTEHFTSASQLKEDAADPTPHFVWCGAGYTEDVLFLVRALSLVNHQGHRCKLRIITSAFLGWTPQAIRAYAVKQGLPSDAIDFRVGLDDSALAACYKAATAHLLVMWDDDKSKTRMPNKLAEYLASGRPVITCAVGELLDFLVDGVNAYVGQPGNERDFANNMIAVLQDPERASRIGAAGQRTCIGRFDYRLQIENLSRFFTTCIVSGKREGRNPREQSVASDRASTLSFTSHDYSQVPPSAESIREDSEEMSTHDSR